MRGDGAVITEGVAMDILEEIRRAEEGYRRKNGGERPLRIVLGGLHANAFAAELLARSDALSCDIDTKRRSPDEVFMCGGTCYFKGVPVFAQLEDYFVLTLGVKE